VSKFAIISTRYLLHHIQENHAKITIAANSILKASLEALIKTMVGNDLKNKMNNLNKKDKKLLVIFFEDKNAVAIETKNPIVVPTSVTLIVIHK
jgi:hypothetical protein